MSASSGGLALAPRFERRQFLRTMGLASATGALVAGAGLFFHWPTAAACALIVGGCLGAGAVVWRTGSTLWATRVLLVLCGVSLVLPIAVEAHLDGAVLTAAALIPYLASVLGGNVEGKRWLAVTFGLVTVGLLLRSVPGLATAPAAPEAITLIRALAVVCLLFALGLQYEAMRQEAMEDLSRADRAKSVFLANVSHEIRTPMNGVLGMTEVLLQSELSDEQREHLLIMRRSGQSLVALINDLLDLTKVESGKLSVTLQPFPVRELLRDVHQLFEPLAREHGLQLTLDVDASVPPRLICDELRVRQVLTNLVGNAVKFTPSGRVDVKVNLRQPAPDANPELLLEVEDTGIGIPDEVLPRLFTAFTQADDSTTRRFGGSGLGLALSRQLVLLLGGQLTVQTVVGQGSCFRVALPVELAPATAEPAQATPAAADVASSPGTVLVVDDNVVNMKVACALLQRAGWATQTATNGAEALAAVQQAEFALVLMDCHMPNMDGFEATERIRALDSKAKAVPIVALTASALPEELEACRRSGMDDCLTKPLSRVALERVLHRFTTRSAAPAPASAA